jgi:hypothetical protein
LRRILFVVGTLSALALLWPASGPTVVAALEHGPGDGRASGPSATPAGAQPAPEALPEHLPSHIPEPSSFDPFVGVQQSTPAAAPASAPPPFVGPIYVPPPPPPTINYRYMGQLVDPAGKRVVYLARPDKEVPVAVGTQLDEGYVVESVSSDGVRLLHPPTKSKVLIPLPHGAEVAALMPSSSPK